MYCLGIIFTSNTTVCLNTQLCSAYASSCVKIINCRPCKLLGLGKDVRLKLFHIKAEWLSQSTDPSNALHSLTLQFDPVIFKVQQNNPGFGEVIIRDYSS